MKFVFIALLLAVSYPSLSQRCATSDYLLQHAMSNQRPFGTGTNLSGSRDTIDGEVIVVPVVVHVLYNNNSQNIPDEQIIAQINSLNRDFRRLNPDTVNTPTPFKHLATDTRIVFCLAKVDPDGYKTTGIERKFTQKTSFLADDAVKYSSKGGTDAWDASKYLNIWVCDLFGRTLGYSTMPGGYSKVDGIVIQYGVFGYEKGVRAPYNKGRTLTHEMGHWLGLKHIWGDFEDSGCSSDDVDDTPPQSASNTGCNTFPKISTCSIDNNGDMFMNYMDFSDDACMNMFTWGQRNKMRAQFASGGNRNSLLGSNLCDGSGAQEGPEIPVEENTAIHIYPNPVVDKLIIETNDSYSGTSKILTIYNLQGKLLVKKILQGKSESVSLSNYPNGLYIINIESGSGRKVFKILKQAGIRGR